MDTESRGTHKTLSEAIECALNNCLAVNEYMPSSRTEFTQYKNIIRAHMLDFLLNGIGMAYFKASDDKETLKELDNFIEKIKS